MNRYLIIGLTLVSIISCKQQEKYDINQYYEKPKQDSVMASIITYIFVAPPYTLMKDRFGSAHRTFYTNPQVTSLFSIKKYYISDDGTNYFYILRPGARIGEKRGVGGYFKMDDHFTLRGFREIFVTPILSEEEATKKGSFLFDKLVDGEIEEYLVMKSYVQWPNEGSYYDTITAEWVLNKEKLHLR